MRTGVVALLLLVTPLLAAAEEGTYVGTWKTTNRPLDGTMTCVVKSVGPDKWQGRFHGVWQGVPFDYTVPFTGPPLDLKGTANIDGASYAWTGSIGSAVAGEPDSSGTFKATFTGNRYLGSFELKQRPPSATATRPSAPPRR